VNHTKVVARITIRYRENINATMRVVHKGKAYNIEGVLPDPDSGMEYLTLPVSEGVSDGQ
jgi:SPP1 family predicted phage head-tail adaptor